MSKNRRKSKALTHTVGEYDGLLGNIAELLEESRRTAARAVNSVLTATYWEIGRRIVEFEQGGEARAEYGAELLKRLGADLTTQFGRGFSKSNLFQMRGFYLGWEIFQTPSGKFELRVRLPDDQRTISGEKSQTASAQFSRRLMTAFPLSWSHYVRLMAVDKPHARAFYEAESIRGGWSVRQLARQIGTQFFERTSQSKQQAAMLTRGRNGSVGRQAFNEHANERTRRSPLCPPALWQHAT